MSLSTLEGSLAVGGDHSGQGPAVGFARLAAGLLVCLLWLPARSQVTAPVEAWHLSTGNANTVAMNGRVDFRRNSWRTSVLGLLWGNGVASQELLGSGAQVMVVVTSGHARATGGDGYHVLACAWCRPQRTPRGPPLRITDGGDWSARPQNPTV